MDEDNKILKVDYDFTTNEKKAIEFLTQRLEILHKKYIIRISSINHIILIHKKHYSFKIYLNKEFDKKNIVILQLLLNSDYKKEIETIRNIVHKRANWNILFDFKVYADGNIIVAQKKDITKKVLDQIKSSLEKEKFKKK